MILKRSNFIIFAMVIMASSAFIDKFFEIGTGFSNKVEISVMTILLIFSISHEGRIPRVIKSITSIFFFVIVFFGIGFDVDKYKIGQLLLDCKILIAIVVGYHLTTTSLIVDRLPFALNILLFFCVILVFIEQYFPSYYLNYFPYTIIDLYVPHTNIRRSSGMFSVSGGLGIFSAVCVVIFYGLKQYERASLRVISGLLMAVFCLIMSGQRLEILGVLIAITYLFTSSRGWPLARTLIIIGAVGLVFFWESNYEDTVYTLSKKFETGEKMVRIQLVEGAAQLANKNFPFGSGLGTYASSMSLINPQAAYFEAGITDLWWRDMRGFYTDGYWAMIVGELGWIAGIILLSMLVRMIDYPRKGLWVDDREMRFSAGVSVMCLCVFLVSSLGSPVYTARFLPLMIMGFYYGHYARLAQLHTTEN